MTEPSRSSTNESHADVPDWQAVDLTETASDVPETADDNDPEDKHVPDPNLAGLPGDHAIGVDKWGTTGEEELEGEPLALKLDREVPDTGPGGADQPVYETSREEALADAEDEGETLDPADD
ncbi:MAG: hypothetical protein ACTHMZ_05885 [Actinomycetes bacterium]